MKSFLPLCVFILSVTIDGIKARNKPERIIGGSCVSSSKYPFAVRLIILTNNKHFLRTRCGATIIQKKWVVTAAHCLDRFTRLDIDEGRAIIYGNTSYTNTSGIDHQIIYYYIHESFQELRSNAYDIALLQVLKPFNGASEKRITVAPPDYNYRTGTTATLLGWGYINKEVTIRSNVLLATDTTLMHHDDCFERYKFFNQLNGGIMDIFINDKILCTWAYNKGSCDEDNGGPLVQKNVLIGIISARVECASDYLPTFFTKVSSFSDWINQVILRRNKMKKG